MQARKQDARGLIDTAPGRAWQRACQAMRLLGDPHLPNAVSDESVRIEAQTTLLATAARLLVDGVPVAVRRDEVVNMAAEAIVLLGSTDHYGHAFRGAGCVDAGAGDGAVRATSTPRSRSKPTAADCAKRCRRWRSGCAALSRRSPATRPQPPPTLATSRAG